ncbi:MAG: succinate dehydrogenase assembly factor 2 [Rhodobacteraceae bacterium]|nr:succinate dehydrogenase assembly factor 2 [Paracoccaceae bacterium]
MSDAEPREIRMKRLAMRSWRRGTKEMDLILGPWADAHLAAMPPEAMTLYEALLSENDQDLYLWVTGAQTPPDRFVLLLADIGRFSRTRHHGG